MRAVLPCMVWVVTVLLQLAASKLVSSLARPTFGNPELVRRPSGGTNSQSDAEGEWPEDTSQTP